MALALSCLKMIAQLAVPKLVKKEKALILGHPDIGNVTAAQLSETFGTTVDEPSVAAALRAIGIEESFVLDVSPYESADIVADLGAEIAGFDNRFDLIIDNGTIEHVFNVGQAFLNLKKMCAPGGVIFHLNPLNLVNHGFWNFSPCTYYDFYESNGFECEVWLRDIPAQTFTAVQYHPKVTTVPEAVRQTIHCIARKVDDVPDHFPVQRRWAAFHTVEKPSKPL